MEPFFDLGSDLHASNGKSGGQIVSSFSAELCAATPWELSAPNIVRDCFFVLMGVPSSTFARTNTGDFTCRDDSSHSPGTMSLLRQFGSMARKYCYLCDLEKYLVPANVGLIGSAFGSVLRKYCFSYLASVRTVVEGLRDKKTTLIAFWAACKPLRWKLDFYMTICFAAEMKSDFTKFPAGPELINRLVEFGEGQCFLREEVAILRHVLKTVLRPYLAVLSDWSFCGLCNSRSPDFGLHWDEAVVKKRLDNMEEDVYITAVQGVVELPECMASIRNNLIRSGLVINLLRSYLVKDAAVLRYDTGFRIDAQFSASLLRRIVLDSLNRERRMLSLLEQSPVVEEEIARQRYLSEKYAKIIESRRKIIQKEEKRDIGFRRAKRGMEEEVHKNLLEAIAEKKARTKARQEKLARDDEVEERKQALLAEEKAKLLARFKKRHELTDSAERRLAWRQERLSLNEKRQDARLEYEKEVALVLKNVTENNISEKAEQFGGAIDKETELAIEQRTKEKLAKIGETETASEGFSDVDVGSMLPTSDSASEGENKDGDKGSSGTPEPLVQDDIAEEPKEVAVEAPSADEPSSEAVVSTESSLAEATKGEPEIVPTEPRNEAPGGNTSNSKEGSMLQSEHGGGDAVVASARLGKESQLDDHFVPFIVGIRRSICDVLMQQHLILDRVALHVCIEELRVFEYFDALRKFCLLEAGDFGRDLLLSLLGGIDLNERNVMRRQLDDVLDGALKMSGRTSDRLADKLKLALDPFAKEAASEEQYSPLQRVRLSLDVPWPLSIIISPWHQREGYQRICQLLLEHRHSLYALQAAWQVLNSVASKSSYYDRRLRKLQFLWQQLSHFVGAIHEYLVTELISSSWTEFAEALDDAKGIGDLVAIHDKFVRNALSRCMLDVQSQPMLLVVRAIFGLAVKFRNQVIMWRGLQKEVEDWDERDEEAAQRQYDVVLRVEITFEKYVTFLVRVIRKLVARSRTSHYSHLLMRLDYSNFYMKGR